MDPLSVTASILAVLTAVQTSLSGLRKLKACWRAPQEIEKLLDELSDLQDVLQEINKYAPQARHAPNEPQIQILTRRVKIAGMKITEMNDLLTNLSPYFSGLGNASQARLVWLQNKNRVKILQQDLHDVRLDLGMIMNLLTAYVSAIQFGPLEPSSCLQVMSDLPRHIYVAVSKPQLRHKFRVPKRLP